LGIANNYRYYYYSFNCDRPLRPKEETQIISEGFGDNRRTLIECLVCVSVCGRPHRPLWPISKGSGLVIAVFGGAFLHLGRMWFTAPDANYLCIFGWFLVGFLLFVAFIISPTGSCKYWSIYERWVKNHGSNPETWPKNKLKFDLWPDHVHHYPEATKTMLQTPNCTACGKCIGPVFSSVEKVQDYLSRR